MIAISKSQLIVWADTVGIPNLALAEHDLRLTYALAGLYAEPTFALTVDCIRLTRQAGVPPQEPQR